MKYLTLLVFLTTGCSGYEVRQIEGSNPPSYNCYYKFYPAVFCGQEKQKCEIKCEKLQKELDDR